MLVGSVRWTIQPFGIVRHAAAALVEQARGGTIENALAYFIRASRQ
jgi:hypothetical protein